MRERKRASMIWSINVIFFLYTCIVKGVGKLFMVHLHFWIYVDLLTLARPRVIGIYSILRLWHTQISRLASCLLSMSAVFNNFYLEFWVKKSMPGGGPSTRSAHDLSCLRILYNATSYATNWTCPHYWLEDIRAGSNVMRPTRCWTDGFQRKTCGRYIPVRKR